MDTSLYVCSFSAFEYWHLQRPAQSLLRLDDPATVLKRLEPSGVCVVRLSSIGRRVPNDERVHHALSQELRGLSTPIDLLVSQATGRSETALKHCCVWGGAIPYGAFAKISQDVYIATPELALLQISRSLSLPETVKLFFEACGTYALPFRKHEGYIRCSPMTRIDSLRRFFARTVGASGVKQARRAARLAIDRAASPAEASMVALACLPRSMGGYGLPFPTMNHSLDVPDDLRGFVGQNRIVCDAYWPDKPYVLEYDGRVYHSGEENVVRDYARANGLAALHIPSTVLTKRELYNAVAFDEAVKAIAKALHARLRHNQGSDSAWRVRRRELREVFLRPVDPWRAQ